MLGFCHKDRAERRYQRGPALPKRPERRHAVAKRQLPSPELLRQLLRYEPETGRLFWLHREPRHFNHSERRTADQSCSAWNTRYAGKEAFTYRCPKTGYPMSYVLNQNMTAHRVIVAMMSGEWPFEVDHDNGIHDDNRWTNLNPVASRSEQMKNQRLRSDNTSGVFGVGLDHGAWRARIGKKWIGRFKSFDEAVAARRAAEIEEGYHPNHGRR
jgi:hypothetical protein